MGTSPEVEKEFGFLLSAEESSSSSSSSSNIFKMGIQLALKCIKIIY